MSDAVELNGLNGAPNQPYGLRDDEIESLRKAVLEHLESQGFRVSKNERGLLIPVAEDKNGLRDLHREAVEANRVRARRGLERLDFAFTRRLMSGSELDPTEIRPALRLLPQGRSRDAELWRWTALHWSVPVSSGYGRRLRFLVVDEGHDEAIIGIIGLADPVFALAARDSAIGWNPDDRRARLANVMDAYVVGAVPPYSMLLGGKLVALLLSSLDIRQAFADRYGSRQSRILERDTNAQLAMITTSSALGRSSIYNRVRYPDGSVALDRVGLTRGSGDFHFSGAIYDRLSALAYQALGEGVTHRHERWGQGFRNRREVVQRSLRELGLSPTNFRLHGVRREVYLSDLAHNSRQWLRHGTGDLDWRSDTTEELGAYWRDRWAVPRAQTQVDWACFNPDNWKLWSI